jgi:hypothetical protein
MKLTGEKLKYWERKTYPSATSSITNPTWTGLVPKPGLRLSQARLFSQMYSIKRTEFNVRLFEGFAAMTTKSAVLWNVDAV